MSSVESTGQHGGAATNVKVVRVPRCGTGKKCARGAFSRLWLHLSLVLCVGLSIRLIHIAQTSAVPTARHLVGDAARYVEWARTIAQGDWLGTESFYQAPLYPYALAIVFRAFGESTLLVRVLQAIGTVGAIAFLSLAIRRWRDARTAIVAAWMLALYAPSIYMDGIIQKESLGNMFVCVVASCCLDTSALRRRSALGLGLIVGCLCLLRENALIWVPVIAARLAFRLRTIRQCHGAAPVDAREPSRSRGEDARPEAPGPGTPKKKRRVAAKYRAEADRAQVAMEGASSGSASVAVLSSRRSSFVLAAWFLLAAALPLGVVSARNWYVSSEWSPTTFQSGTNFYIGNSAEADGRYRPLVKGHETPAFERADATAIAEKETGRKLTAREVSHYWRNRALADIAANPARWAMLMLKKWAMVWNDYEVADAESIAVYEQSSPMLLVLNRVWTFGPLSAFAAVGLFAAVFGNGSRFRGRTFDSATPGQEQWHAFEPDGERGGVVSPACAGGSDSRSDRRIAAGEDSANDRKGTEDLNSKSDRGGADSVHGIGLLLALLVSMAMAVTVFYVLGRYRFPLVPLLVPLAAAGAISMWDAWRSRRGGDESLETNDRSLTVAALFEDAALKGAGADGKSRGVCEFGMYVVVGVAAFAFTRLPVHDQAKLDAFSFMNAGVALAEAGELSPAIIYFEFAVETNPESAEAHANLAQAFAVAGRFAEAIPHYESAFRISSSLPGLEYNWAVALENTGDVAGAKAMYQRALTRNPADAQAAEAVGRLNKRRE